MARREFFAGGNFSGRSDAMLALLRSGAFGSETFFIGPYAEAALSGLTATVGDEIALYRAGPGDSGVAFGGIAVAEMSARKPQSLSGGEQMLLALHCFSVSPYTSVAIDTALEQLDGDNRARALAYVEDCGRDVVLIDNRMPSPAGWTSTERTAAAAPFACDWAALKAAIMPCAAPRIAVEDLDFSYRNGPAIFRGASIALEPGMAHRLSGPNGAGKTTFLKILVGALVPAAGTVTLAGARYEPWRHGNRALALATQNPDQQWCGATLAEDMARRRKALGTRGEARALGEQRLVTLARCFGLATLDQHLYELPLAARKRVSWLWPLAGAHPWLMFDEPTIGQDAATRECLARLIETLCAAGYGILFVTHDDAFAARLPHRVLRVENRSIRSS